MDIILPQNISAIISIINSNGHEAYLVGGCVRDIIMGREPEDWDIATSATTDIIKSIFNNTFDTGLKHGTVTVLYGDAKAEVTTYRKEAAYSDHRRPDFVIPTNSLTEDLSRRDFTINSMAYHPDQGLRDPFNGLEDIKNRIIRCVGDPFKRFSEDALRMLRAVRFSAQLGFDIEKNTLNAINEAAPTLAYVSMERIQTEINKILISPLPEKLALLWETRLSKTIFPEISQLDEDWCKYVRYFTRHKSRKNVLLTLLFITSFGDNAANCARVILRRLKYDNATIREVSRLIESINSWGTLSDRNLRKAVSEYGYEITEDTIAIIEVMKNPDETGDAGDNSKYLNLQNKVKPLKLAVSGLDLNKNLLINGSDINEMLTLLRLCVYEKPEINIPDVLLSIAQKIKDSNVKK